MGFSENGMKFAENWNNSTFLLTERAGVDIYCRFYIKIWDTPDRTREGKWLKTSWNFHFHFSFSFVIFTEAYTTK